MIETKKLQYYIDKTLRQINLDSTVSVAVYIDPESVPDEEGILQIEVQVMKGNWVFHGALRHFKFDKVATFHAGVDVEEFNSSKNRDGFYQQMVKEILIEASTQMEEEKGGIILRN